MQKSTKFFSSKVLILKHAPLCYSPLISFSVFLSAMCFYFVKCKLFVFESSRFQADLEKMGCNILKNKSEYNREVRCM